MPAAPLSPSVPGLDQLALAVTGSPPRSVSPAGLLAVFAQVTDPRKRRGRRHRLPVLLTLATCAVLAGARSFTAIAEWAADAGETVWSALGIARVPDASTFRRVFAALDADALDTVLGAWAAAVTPSDARPHDALDDHGHLRRPDRHRAPGHRIEARRLVPGRGHRGGRLGRPERLTDCWLSTWLSGSGRAPYLGWGYGALTCLNRACARRESNPQPSDP
ncbi:hypothetical protein FAGKG844_360022 [Frankia sp. AgKG'84/4]